MSNVFEGLNTSERIKGILSSRGKTQGDLSRLLNMTQATISGRMKDNKWEVEELKIIAAEFGILPTDLI